MPSYRQNILVSGTIWYSVYFDVFSVQWWIIGFEMHEAFPATAQPFLLISKRGRHHYEDLDKIQHSKFRMCLRMEASDRGQCCCDQIESISRKSQKRHRPPQTSYAKSEDTERSTMIILLQPIFKLRSREIAELRCWLWEIRFFSHFSSSLLQARRFLVP